MRFFCKNWKNALKCTKCEKMRRASPPCNSVFVNIVRVVFDHFCTFFGFFFCYFGQFLRAWPVLCIVTTCLIFFLRELESFLALFWSWKSVLSFPSVSITTLSIGSNKLMRQGILSTASFVAFNHSCTASTPELYPLQYFVHPSIASTPVLRPFLYSLTTYGLLLALFCLFGHCWLLWAVSDNFWPHWPLLAFSYMLLSAFGLIVAAFCHHWTLLATFGHF